MPFSSIQARWAWMHEMNQTTMPKLRVVNEGGEVFIMESDLRSWKACRCGDEPGCDGFAEMRPWWCWWSLETNSWFRQRLCSCEGHFPARYLNSFHFVCRQLHRKCLSRPPCLTLLNFNLLDRHVPFQKYWDGKADSFVFATHCRRVVSDFAS